MDIKLTECVDFRLERERFMRSQVCGCLVLHVRPCCWNYLLIES